MKGFPTQPEDGVLKESSWGGKKVFCEKCGFGALPAGYIFIDQKNVKDSKKYAFFWSADDLGLMKQTHYWCLDDEENILYQTTFPKTMKMTVRYLVDFEKIDEIKEYGNE